MRTLWLVCCLWLVAAGCSDADAPDDEVLGARIERSTTTSAPTTTTTTTPTTTDTVTAAAPEPTSPPVTSPPPTAAPTTAAPPPPDTTTTTAAPTTGRIAGTLVVDPGTAYARVTLTLADDTEVQSFEATATSDFAFDDLAPGTYVLELYRETTTTEGPDEGTSSADLSRTEPFDVAAGDDLRFTCQQDCERA